MKGGDIFNKTGEPNKLDYARALQQWKNIEYLVGRTQHLNIATHLLESTTCDKLTRLRISFDDYAPMAIEIYRNLLQDLIKNIYNAPSLEHVPSEKQQLG